MVKVSYFKYLDTSQVDLSNSCPLEYATIRYPTDAPKPCDQDQMSGHTTAPSVSKTEVQPLVPFILRCGKVMLLLLLRHVVPKVRTLLIDIDIEQFRTNEQCKIIRADTDQHLVALPVHWLVLVAIDLGMVSQLDDWLVLEELTLAPITELA